MDFKVSRKEKRWQPKGPVMELVDNVFDLYPIHGNPFDEHIITDIEILTDPADEQLDRAMFAIVKQRGLDPTELDSGVQWAENLLGEVPSALILVQIQQGVHDEGPGVRLTPVITAQGTDFTIELTNPRVRSIM